MKFQYVLLGLAVLLNGCSTTDYVGPTPFTQPTLQVPLTAPLPEPTPTSENTSAALSTSDWAVQLSPEVEPNAFALEYHAENLGQIGSLTYTYLFRRPCPVLNQDGVDTLAMDTRVIWLEEQIPHQQSLRSTEQTDQNSTERNCSQ